MMYQQQSEVKKAKTTTTEHDNKKPKRKYTDSNTVCTHDFSAVSFHGVNKDSKVMQRKVREADNKIQLVEDKGKEDVVAEVDKERSVYINFHKFNYIISQDVRRLVERNNGILNSSDFLNIFADKEKAAFKEHERMAIKQGKVDPIQNYQRWSEHENNYRTILGFIRRVIGLDIVALSEQGKTAENMYLYLFNNYGLLVEYCGSDCVDALTVLLKCKDTDTKLKNDCKQEIEKRQIEMQMEFNFCIEQNNRRKEEQGAEIACQTYIPRGLLGNDCGAFATISQNAGLGNLSGYNEVEGYTYHKWLNLTSTQGELKDGVATAETCAGQGGLFRTIFSIRPTKNEREILRDTKAIGDMSSLIHTNPGIQNNPDKIVLEIYILRNMMTSVGDLNYTVWLKLIGDIGNYINQQNQNLDPNLKENAQKVFDEAIAFEIKNKSRFYQQ